MYIFCNSVLPHLLGMKLATSQSTQKTSTEPSLFADGRVTKLEKAEMSLRNCAVSSGSWQYGCR